MSGIRHKIPHQSCTSPHSPRNATINRAPTLPRHDSASPDVSLRLPHRRLRRTSPREHPHPGRPHLHHAGPGVPHRIRLHPGRRPRAQRPHQIPGPQPRHDDADATLRGTIVSESASPLTYDSTSGQTSSYLITITARVVLTARDGHVFYQNDALPFREQYQSTQDTTSFIQEDSPAVQRVARDFAQAIVAAILESY